jgi:hypothetical protein
MSRFDLAVGLQSYRVKKKMAYRFVYESLYYILYQSSKY